MDKCKIEKCQLPPIREGKCVLHCKKYSYSNDFKEASFLSSFYNELLSNMVEQIHTDSSRIKELELTRETIKNYLIGDSKPSRIHKAQIPKDIIFDKIVFPSRKGRDHFDYFKLLERIKSIHFDDCSFHLSEIKIPSLEVFFQDCYFKTYWTVNNHKILNNVDNTLYQNCIFEDDVSFHYENLVDDKNIYSLFSDCNFKKKIEISSAVINNQIFNNTPKIELELGELNIVNSSINNKFVLNNSKLYKLNIENVTFNSRFEFKENTVNTFNIFNTNFHKIFDAYKSAFGTYTSEKCIFYDFSGFELCDFSFSNKKLSTFKYVTFLSFVNYRNAIFHGGLDLENTNLKESINFLKAEIKSDNTNRETYRIIKNSFDLVGNNIEANKYFALEMKQYKKELTNKKVSQEKFIFWLNEKISNFGMSYIRPIFLIFIFAFIYQLIIIGYENNYLYTIFPKYNYQISSVSDFFNDIASNIIPFGRFLSKGLEFVSLIFYIIFASLIWQAVVSIKKHTRSN